MMSRIITGIIMIIVGISLIVTSFFTSFVLLVYGIVLFILGFVIFFNNQEDKIEKIKPEKVKGGKNDNNN